MMFCQLTETGVHLYQQEITVTIVHNMSYISPRSAQLKWWHRFHTVTWQKGLPYISAICEARTWCPPISLSAQTTLDHVGFSCLAQVASTSRLRSSFVQWSCFITPNCDSESPRHKPSRYQSVTSCSSLIRSFSSAHNHDTKHIILATTIQVKSPLFKHSQTINLVKCLSNLLMNYCKMWRALIN